MYQFPINVSPTRLNTAVQCLFRFSCENDPETRVEFVDNPQSFAGKAMHLALKSFFNLREVPEQERKPERIGDLLRRAWSRVPKGSGRNIWSTEDRRRLFKSPEQERMWGLQSIDILRNYLIKANLSVEPLLLEDWLTHEVDGISFIGRVDRIDRDGEHGIAIWDYKTGKLPFSDPTEMIGDYSDYQLPLYALLASHRFPFAERVRVGLIYVSHSKVYQRSWDRDHLSEVQADILAFAKKLRARTTFPPSVNGLCPWCNYREICPARDSIPDREAQVEEVDW